MPDNKERLPVVYEYPEGYHAALGRFVEAFAGMECHLFILVVETLKISVTDAMAIFTDFRTARAKDVINRVRTARAIPSSPLLEETFAHISIIENVRNDLLHYGLTFYHGDGGQWVASNSFLARIGTKPRLTPVSVEILDAMTQDLHHIWDRLMLFGQDPTPDDHLQQHVWIDVWSPWRYKPSSLGSHG